MMEPDEIVVARLNQGATVLRYVDRTPSRVTLALGRNKQAKLPADRILYATGIVHSDYETFLEFRDGVEEAAKEIDLSEVWEVTVDEQVAMSVEEVADLYHDSGVGPAEMVALTLHLDSGSDYFVQQEGRQVPRTEEDLEALRARRRREAENAEAAKSLMAALYAHTLPDPMSRLHEGLLDHIRGFAVHGDEYTRSYAAHTLLRDASDGTRDLQRRAFDLLVGAGIFSEDEPLELHRAEIEEDIPRAALDEADSFRQHPDSDDRERLDLTDLESFTIDDADTHDRDDALSLETVDGGYRVGVHIADAGASVPVNGAMDAEADRRMATLYLPERSIPMLPPTFVHGIGSLDPDQVRPAVSLLVRTDELGQVQDYEIRPSLIRSRAAISYGEADEAITDETDSWHPVLRPLSDLAQTLLARRERAGAINVNREEMVIKVASSSDIEVRVVTRSTPARDLVSEMMVLCNSLMADYCKVHEIPASYRSQSAPDVSDLGLFDEEGVLRPLTRLQRYRLMRRFTPAVISVTPTPHVGLGVDAYIQATSPLRRYPDLVMQRQISHYLAAGEPVYSEDDISSVAKRAEVQMRELTRIEEARRRYWFLKFLMLTRLHDADGADHFTAYVLENEPRRLAALDLDEYPFRVRAELPNSIEPGTTVTLKLTGVDLWRRHAYFLHVPHSQVEEA